jgi:processing peptidase subunit beta
MEKDTIWQELEATN